MKKSVFSLILGASLMVSSSALALTAMTDSNMKDATGQAGVSIALDDITLYQAIGQTVYTDNDGFVDSNATAEQDRSGAAAGVFITGSETLTTIRAIFAGDTNRGGFLAHDYDDVYADNLGGSFTSKALTIDVSDTAYLMTTGKSYNINQFIANNGTYDGSAVANGVGGFFGTGGDAALAAELQEKGVKKAFNIAASGQLKNYRSKIEGALMAGAAAAGTPITPEVAAQGAELIITQATALTAGGAELTDTLISEINTAIAGAGATVDSLARGIAGTDTWENYATKISDPTQLAVAGVVIGLPTIEIRKSGSLKHIGVTAQTGTANSGNSFIAVKKTDSTLAILDGYVEICPH